MFLYLIQAGHTQFCKIGITGQPKNRKKQLQTGNPQKLYIRQIWAIEDKQIESKIHAIFNTVFKKANGGKEWFRINDLDLAIRIIDSSID